MFSLWGSSENGVRFGPWVVWCSGVAVAGISVCTGTAVWS